MKKVFNKVFTFAMNSLPVVLTGLLIIHTNSLGSFLNGQPEAPASLKKYRKF